MDPAEQPDPELDQLRERWLGRLDENLAQGSLGTDELDEFARRSRAFADTTASSGQRRAARAIAERFERAAHDRVTTNP